MSKEDIRIILDYCFTPVIDLLLSMVNLKEIERNVIELVERQGITEERTAERLNVSRNTVQNYKKSAFKKIAEVWAYNPVCSLILSENKMQ